MKKIIGIMFGLGVALCLLTACGAEKEPVTVSLATPAPTVEATEAPKAAETPDVKESPKETEAPDVTEASDKTESPAATEVPVVTDESAAVSDDAKALAESLKGEPVDKLIEAIGEPQETVYASSCLGPGQDGQWSYDGFSVYTYKEGDSEIVQDVD